jgi:lysozyme
MEPRTALEERWESCPTRGGLAYPYLDPIGIPTQGFGAIRGLTGERVRLTDAPWTMEQARFVLRRDWLLALRGAEPLMETVLSERQWEALVSWVFNLGAGNLKISTLRRVINREQWGRVPSEWVKWNRAGGRVLTGLTRRRQAEIAVWASP